MNPESEVDPAGPLSPPPSSREVFWFKVGWALVALGWILALARYGARLGFRYDEARVILNLMERSYGELLQPLSYEQGAPVGFLWMHKAMMAGVSFSEWGLRLPTLVAGLAAVWWVRKAACNLAGPRLGALAVWLFLGHRLLGLYVPEVKQYAFDVATTAGMVWVWTCLPRGALRSRTVGGLALMGMVSPWLSHASLFGLTGFGLALLWRSVTMKAGRRELAKVVLIGGTWVASFAALYTLQLQDLAGAKWTLQWWDKHFAPFPPTSLREVSWYMSAWGKYMGFFQWGWILGPFWGLGVWRTGREDRGAWILFLLPGLVALGASAGEAYPFHDRLLLFAVPLVSLPLARGVLWCWDYRLRPAVVQHGARLLIALGLLCWGALGGAGRFFDHNNMINIRPLIERVEAEFRAGDVVWLEGEMDFPRQVYGPMLDLDISKWVQGGAWSHSSQEQVNSELRQIEAPRIWVMATLPRRNSIWPRKHASAVGFERPARTVMWTRSSVLYLLE